LKLLVDEIRVEKKEVRLSGSYAAIAGALSMLTKRSSGHGETLADIQIMQPYFLPRLQPFTVRKGEPVGSPSIWQH
jgi:hypothetical protein